MSNDSNYHFDFDELKMYFAEDLVVSDYLTIKQPTIGDIVTFGEMNVESSIMPFVSNSTTHRLQLWEVGVDWNKISDYQLFLMFYPALTPKITKLVFDGYDFSKLIPYKDADEQISLYDSEGNEVINEMTYYYISQYLKKMFDRHPKVEKAKGKLTKQAIIDEDKMNLKNKKRNKKKGSSSYLLPLISALVNHPGFKYSTKDLRNVGIVEFMDSVNRLQIYEQCRAFLGGMYSGFMDTSKLSKTELSERTNWLRDISS